MPLYLTHPRQEAKQWENMVGSRHYNLKQLISFQLS